MAKKATRQISLGNRTLQFIKQNYAIILLSVLFLFFLFFHFYQLSERASWGWDQVDVAWNAQKILINHEYPVVGMIAKGNTGFHIGPLYYYLAAAFYKLTDMHPIASALLAAFSSLAGFFAIYYVTKRIFSEKIALIAVAINTFSSFVIQYDRTQWPVNFIVPISALIFYSLYKIITGSPKYLLLLAIMLGLSLQVHFTSVFYFILVLLALPFFPRTRETIRYGLYAIPLFAVWIISFLIADAQGGRIENSISTYLKGSYHGFHLRRVIQLTRDAFIEFQAILFFKPFAFISFLFLPLFLFIYLYRHVTRDKLLFCYLACLWFLVPWLAFSTYSGEITNYYFFITRPVALMILAYLTYRALTFHRVTTLLVITFWSIYIVTNTQEFLKKPQYELGTKERMGKERMMRGEKIEMYQNVPEAYWQWYYQEYKK